jgi:mRNA-degrading endonuclease toxin of MazEF toxin-antitoxin module
VARSVECAVVRDDPPQVFIAEDQEIEQPSVINCDGLHTVARSSLTTFVGTVDEDTLGKVCWAVSYALGC